MDAVQDDADHQIAWLYVQGPLAVRDVVYQAGRSCRIAPLQVVRPERVLGPDHLLAAQYHAAKAVAQGRAQADRPEVEFLRYLAAEPQIRKAIDRMGVQDGGDGLVIALGARRLDAIRHFVEALGLRPASPPASDAQAVPELATLQAFGITQEAWDATTPAKRGDLILEAVASVATR